jgi:ATP-binding cassette subfamily C (CFTR/MRP) protein 1
MEEIMRGIKLIKIYGWEESFAKNLQTIRGEEALMLARINRVKAAMLGLIFCLPPLLCAVIFGTQEATASIDPTVIFTCLSFFNTLRVPFSKLPKRLRDVLDALSAMEPENPEWIIDDGGRSRRVRKVQPVEVDFGRFDHR